MKKNQIGLFNATPSILFNYVRLLYTGDAFGKLFYTHIAFFAITISSTNASLVRKDFFLVDLKKEKKKSSPRSRGSFLDNF